MKLIKAVIRPFKLESVKEALVEIGIGGLTVTEVRGFGRQRGDSEIYGRNDETANFLPKIMIELAVNEELVLRATNIIAEAAKTGKVGDGKIFVTPLEEVVRIRTDERGEDAV